MRFATLGIWTLIVALLTSVLAFLAESWLAVSNVSFEGKSTSSLTGWMDFVLLPANLVWFASMALHVVGAALALWAGYSRWRPGLWGVSMMGALVFVWSLSKLYALFWLAKSFQSRGLLTVNLASVSLAVAATTTLLAAIAAASITLTTARCIIAPRPPT